MNRYCIIKLLQRRAHGVLQIASGNRGSGQSNNIFLFFNFHRSCQYIQVLRIRSDPKFISHIFQPY